MVPAAHQGDDPLCLYLTDLHFAKEKPRYRVGDFVGDLMAKLEEVGRIIRRTKAPMVVIGGDLTETPMVSLEMGDRMLDELESWEVPIHVVVGNHDVFGNQLKTLPSSWLGHVFRRSKSIQMLSTLYVSDVCIWGVHYDTGIEDRLRDPAHGTESAQLFYNTETLFDADGNPTADADHKPIAEKLVEVVHAMVVPGGMHPDARQIDPVEYHTRADLVLSGDYHPGWPDEHVRMDGTRFVNPGAFARRTVSDSDCNRGVRVVLVRHDLSVEFIALKSMKSAAETFDLEAAAKLKEKEHELKEFVEELGANTAERIDVRERVIEIAKEKKVRNDIRDLALERYDRMGDEA